MSTSLAIPLTTGHGRQFVAEIEDNAGSEFAVILPGLRYGCDRPLLRGVAEIFQSRGCDIARLNFDYAEDAEFMEAEDDARLAQIASDGCDIIDNLLASKHYRLVWVVGKSLGTVSMGAPLSQRTLPKHSLRAIWLTPSLIGTPLQNQILDQAHNSLVVIGSNDPSFRTELMSPFQSAPNIHLCVVEGANHGFEHPDGVAASKKAVSVAVKAVETWVRVQSAEHAFNAKSSMS